LAALDRGREVLLIRVAQQPEVPASDGTGPAPGSTEPAVAEDAAETAADATDGGSGVDGTVAEGPAQRDEVGGDEESGQ